MKNVYFSQGAGMVNNTTVIRAQRRLNYARYEPMRKNLKGNIILSIIHWVSLYFNACYNFTITYFYNITIHVMTGQWYSWIMRIFGKQGIVSPTPRLA